MSIELICPECGGIIGQASSGHRAPCTCPVAPARPMKQAAPAMEAAEPEESDKRSDTDVLDSPEPVVEKICFQCGKNVAGHRRVKDSRGYLCLDCAKAERKSETAGTVPCDECKRRLKPGGLFPYRNKRICKSCLDHHVERDRVTKKVSGAHYEEHEKKTLLWLIIAAGVLGLVILISLMR